MRRVSRRPRPQRKRRRRPTPVRLVRAAAGEQYPRPAPRGIARLQRPDAYPARRWLRRLGSGRGRGWPHPAVSRTARGGGLQGLLERFFVEVEVGGHLEPDRLQRLAHRQRIGTRVDQRRHVAVAVVADDQGLAMARSHGQRVGPQRLLLWWRDSHHRRRRRCGHRHRFSGLDVVGRRQPGHAGGAALQKGGFHLAGVVGHPGGHLPFPGLALLGGARYSASKYASQAGNVEVGGYTVFDLGSRYRTRVGGYDTVLRLTVDNVFDRRYWRDAGAYLGDGYVFQGAPRTARVSASVSF